MNAANAMPVPSVPPTDDSNVTISGAEFAQFMRAVIQQPEILDRPHTVEEFAALLQISPRELRRRLHRMPGVVRHTSKNIWIHLRTWWAQSESPGLKFKR